MAKLPKSITTVTLFSKILATLILVLIIPMASFYAGMQYQKSASAQFELSTTVTHTQALETQAKQLFRTYLDKYMNASSSQKITEYKLYRPTDTTEKDGSFTFHITYAVHPATKQANAYWLTGNGLLQADGWITGKQATVEAVKKNGVLQITSVAGK